MESGPISLTRFFSFSIVDHVFEHQMLNNHLAKHNLKYEYVFYFDGIILVFWPSHLMIFLFLLTSNLHPDLKKDVKNILNDPKNMAPIPAKINRGVRTLTERICN